MIDPNINDEWICDIQEQPTESAVIEFLDSQGNDRDFEYSLNITKLVEQISGINIILESILDNESLSSQIRFNAFYALSFYHYRAKNISKLEILHETYRSEFSEQVFYKFLHGVFLRESKDDDNLDVSLRKMDEAVDEYPDNPGILKGAANTYLTALEFGTITREESELIDTAEEYINRAIELYPEYSEYFVERGRIYRHRGEFERAEQAFNRAIDLESKENEDYAVQIADYQYHLAQIQMAKLENQYEAEMESVHEDLKSIKQESHKILREFQNTVIQTLSFFGGLIALIVTFVQVSLTLPLTQATQLVTVLIGGIILAFGGMSVILPATVSLRRVGLIYATGLGLMGAAVISIVLV